MSWQVTANAEELERTVRDLRELVEALDRRVPQVQRGGELLIANAAMTLRGKAIERIAEIERQIAR